MNWVKMPDGTEFLEAMRDGVKGVYWLTYDPTTPDKPWVVTFKPEVELVQVDLPRIPKVGDRLMVDTMSGPEVVEVLSVEGKDVRTRIVEDHD